MSLPDPWAALAQVAAALERVGVPYLVCGSVASSLHGEPRTTHDVDLVADLRLAHVDAFCAHLRPAFYVDGMAIRDAIRQRAMFNVVDYATGIKVDVILLRDRAFSRTELNRAVDTPIPGGVMVKVASAEDTLLAKLEWYRKGGEVSDRQWRDIRGILKVQEGELDLQYLSEWAAQLGVSDLLQRARREVDPA